MMSYSLRLFQADTTQCKYTNVAVGKFKQHPNNKDCLIFENVPQTDVPLSSLQVYPGDASKKTFYDLPPGVVIYVYGYNEKRETQLYGSSCEHDNYIYFTPQLPHVALVFVSGPLPPDSLDWL